MLFNDSILFFITIGTICEDTENVRNISSILLFVMYILIITIYFYLDSNVILLICSAI